LNSGFSGFDCSISSVESVGSNGNGFLSGDDGIGCSSLVQKGKVELVLSIIEGVVGESESLGSSFSLSLGFGSIGSGLVSLSFGEGKFGFKLIEGNLS
jgi:hypothetical protein